MCDTVNIILSQPLFTDGQVCISPLNRYQSLQCTENKGSGGITNVIKALITRGTWLGSECTHSHTHTHDMNTI